MKVTVLGAGIVGLWTADILAEKGHTVSVLAGSTYPQTTSAAAVCVLTPFFPEDPGSATFARGVRWARETLTRFQELDPQVGALERMPCYEFGYQGMLEDGFPVSKVDHLDFTRFTIIPLSEVIAECDFALAFECFMCNTHIFMPWLMERLRGRGVKFVHAQLRRPEDAFAVDSDVVFNCLGHQTVFPDPDLFPVHGQSMFVPADNTGNRRFGIGAGHHAVFAHLRGFYLGSYFMQGAVTTPREELYAESIEFVRTSYARLCGSVGETAPQIDLNRVQRVNSGVRPFRRTGPRVELDTGFGRPVVHNYGHGAHGWTIGYASSVEAVNLIDSYRRGPEEERPQVDFHYESGDRCHGGAP